MAAEARWAVTLSLVKPAINGVEPYDYLRDVLHSDGRWTSVNRLDELLPWA